MHSVYDDDEKSDDTVAVRAVDDDDDGDVDGDGDDAKGDDSDSNDDADFYGVPQRHHADVRPPQLRLAAQNSNSNSNHNDDKFAYNDAMTVDGGACPCAAIARCRVRVFMERERACDAFGDVRRDALHRAVDYAGAVSRRVRVMDDAWRPPSSSWPHVSSASSSASSSFSAAALSSSGDDGVDADDTDDDDGNDDHVGETH